MRPSVCVYEKVRDKLGEMCGEVVMIFVCVCVLVCVCACFQVGMEPSARMTSPKRDKAAPQWDCGMLLVVLL